MSNNQLISKLISHDYLSHFYQLFFTSAQPNLLQSSHHTLRGTSVNENTAGERLLFLRISRIFLRFFEPLPLQLDADHLRLAHKNRPGAKRIAAQREADVHSLAPGLYDTID